MALFRASLQIAEKSTAQPGGSRPFRGEKAMTNEVITPEISLTVPAVLAAFTILSEDIASLPLMLYSQAGKNKFRAYDNPYYRLMHDKPNEEHTSMVFREIMMGHLLAWGNFYGQLITDKKGDVVEIWPLRPDKMIVSRSPDGRKIFTYTNAKNMQRVFDKEEILHIPAFGFDGLIGYSRISLMRNAIGLARAAENFGSKFFGNDARPGLVLKVKKKIDADGAKLLRESFVDVYQGAENKWKVGVLEEGTDLDTVGIPPEDAQFLQTRSFQVGEIARAFRVPPHMIGDVEKSTSWGTGIDSQEQGYVTHTLRPWTTRLEGCMNQQLLLPQDQSVYFYEHLFADLLRGDLATRYEAYIKAINNGIMNRNEVRSRENMNPYKGGDTYMMPANMVTINSNGAQDLTGQTNVNALAPLWKDAINRVVKREMNDLRGAAKRYLSKNQSEAFAKWAGKFYKSDHAAFMSNQFQPLIEAETSLYDVEIDMSEMVEQYLSRRLMSIDGMTIDELEKSINKWQEEIPAQMLAGVINATQEAYIND